MIFRTGSCLIVGKCDEFVLKSIYEFLKNFFKDEYMLICQNPGMPVQEIKKKIPKKCKLIKINYNVYFDNGYIYLYRHEMQKVALGSSYFS